MHTTRVNGYSDMKTGLRLSTHTSWAQHHSLELRLHEDAVLYARDDAMTLQQATIGFTQGSSLPFFDQIRGQYGAVSRHLQRGRVSVFTRHSTVRCDASKQTYDICLVVLRSSRLVDVGDKGRGKCPANVPLVYSWRSWASSR